MFRPMRRRGQEMPPDECEEALQSGSSGVLALLGDEGYPYAVPLSYAYHEGKLYFHCAKSGHKLDAVKRSPRASFCVIVRDDIAPKEYTMHYKSVIVFGTVGIIEEEDKKKKAIEALGRKYAPDDSALNMSEVINKAWDNLCMLEMTIEHKTGKVGKALAQEN